MNDEKEHAQFACKEIADTVEDLIIVGELPMTAIVEGLQLTIAKYITSFVSQGLQVDAARDFGKDLVKKVQRAVKEAKEND